MPWGALGGSLEGLGGDWGALGGPRGSLWPPRGALGGPRESPGSPLGVPGDLQGVPWGAQGPPFGVMGSRKIVENVKYTSYRCIFYVTNVYRAKTLRQNLRTSDLDSAQKYLHIVFRV